MHVCMYVQYVRMHLRKITIKQNRKAGCKSQIQLQSGPGVAGGHAGTRSCTQSECMLCFKNFWNPHSHSMYTQSFRKLMFTNMLAASWIMVHYSAVVYFMFWYFSMSCVNISSYIVYVCPNVSKYQNTMFFHVEKVDRDMTRSKHRTNGETKRTAWWAWQLEELHLQKKT